MAFLLPSCLQLFPGPASWFLPDLLITLAIFIPLSSHKPHRNRWAQEEQWRSWSTRTFHSCTFSSHWPISKFKLSSFYTRVKILSGCRDVRGGGREEFLECICSWQNLRVQLNWSRRQVTAFPATRPGAPCKELFWWTATLSAGGMAVAGARAINGFQTELD